MWYWRKNWPNESVTPKMHILEEHMVPFIRKWKRACGFYGEQGAEGIHRVFNKIGNNHASINDPMMRLKSMLKRQHIDTYPKVHKKELKPVVKSRGPYKKRKLPENELN